MNILLYVAIILFLMLLLLFKFLYRNRVKIGKYEYLEVLGSTEWKAGRVIRRELEEKYGGWLSYGDVYIVMRHLEEEGLVERKISSDEVGPLHEFRKKSGEKSVQMKNPKSHDNYQ